MPFTAPGVGLTQNQGDNFTFRRPSVIQIGIFGFDINTDSGNFLQDGAQLVVLNLPFARIVEAIAHIGVEIAVAPVV